EAGDYLLAVHSGLDNLQGDPTADGMFLLGHVYDPHAPFADLLEELVGTDTRAGTLSNGAGNEICRVGWFVYFAGAQVLIRQSDSQESARLMISIEQRLHLRSKIGSVCASLIHVGLAISG